MRRKTFRTKTQKRGGSKNLFESYFRKMLNEENNNSLEDELDNLEDSEADDADMNALESSLDDEEENAATLTDDETTATSQIAKARQALVDSVNGEITEFDDKLSSFITTIDEFSRFLIDATNEESIKYFVTHTEMLNGDSSNTFASKTKSGLLTELSKTASDCALLANALTALRGSFSATEIVNQQLAASANQG